MRRRRSVSSLAALAALAALALNGVVPARAGTTYTSFTPTDDAYVDASRPSVNTEGSMRLAADGSPTIRSYLRFSVAGLPDRVVRARLWLWAVNDASGFTVRRTSVRWSASTITASNAPSPWARLGARRSYTKGRWIKTDVSSFVRGDGTYAFVVTKAGARAWFASSESGSTAPRLVFETSPDPAIGAAGDIACDPGSPYYNDGDGTAKRCRQVATSNALLRADLDAVLTLGDNQYENGRLWKFEESYDPSWGRLKAITRPSVGNHEYRTTGAAGYFDYFGSAAGSRTKGYYSFDLGAWHVVALNSNCAEVGGCAAGSPQEQWLRADLAASSAPCTLAFWHHPRFSSGYHGNTTAVAPLWKALEDHDAEVILTGHDHDYERFARQRPNGAASTDGIRQFVVGTGGKDLRPFETIRANSQRRNAHTHGVLELTLHPDGYTWHFAQEYGRTWTDYGKTSCR